MPSSSDEAGCGWQHVRPAASGISWRMKRMKTARDQGSNANVALIASAYERLARRDLTVIRDLVDPDFEWTFLDPSEVDPRPRVCRGRQELVRAMERRRDQGLRTELEEVLGRGDQVMVVTRTPGLDAMRARKADDRNFDVLTFRGGRVVALRACRNREDALALVGIA
jgi:ketosteroid isomerase-like protein